MGEKAPLAAQLARTIDHEGIVATRYREIHHQIKQLVALELRFRYSIFRVCFMGSIKLIHTTIKKTRTHRACPSPLFSFVDADLSSGPDSDNTDKHGDAYPDPEAGDGGTGGYLRCVFRVAALPLRVFYRRTLLLLLLLPTQTQTIAFL
jgi:hypothetical protein